jgi:hypothetical protein
MSLDPRKSNPSRFTLNPERVSFWKDSLESDVLKVGICWQGGKRNHSEMIFNDRRRSISLSLIEPILGVDGVNFYSLQKDWKEPHPKINDLMGSCGDFLDCAALVSNMDLVISVDTAVAHLAASLGRPTWVLSRLGGCWRWGNDSEHTFWYPSVRIFRQKLLDDWSPTIEKVKESLVQILSSR